jgi:tRNA dimethylallyltransferase
VSRFLIVIAGPTASGKTSLGITLARRFHTHIISADARQLYLEMNRGTAKPSLEQLAAVPHHFINHLSITDHYSAGQFEREAVSFIENDLKNWPVLIMTGGSGLFIRAVIDGFDSIPPIEPEVKEKLHELWTRQGLVPLQRLLCEHDPVYYNKVDLNNPQRLLRALAVCLTTGKPFSSFRKQQAATRDFVPVNIGLKVGKEVLHRRIAERVDQMMMSGLLEEAKHLFPARHLNALQTVGYTELFNYLEQRTSLEQAVEEIKQNTRQYAKRQITWFKKEKDIKWFDPEQTDEIAQYIESKINQS